MIPTPMYKDRITDASAWQPQDLCHGQTWNICLTNEQVDDLLSGLNQVKDLHIAEINRANFPLPACQDVIKQIADEMRIGRGFSLLHNFPVNGIKNEDIARMYWGFCTYLGTGVTMGAKEYGGLVQDITEGYNAGGASRVGQPTVVPFHNDSADTAMLLCVQQAIDSPKSQFVSSSTIHNVLRERAPDKLYRLYDGFPYDQLGLQYKTEPPITDPVPVFSQVDGLVSSQYNRSRITKAADRSGGLSREDESLFDLLDETAQEFSFSYEFQPGDIQFANNYVVWHGREAHKPATGEHDARLLMRIWLNIDNFRRLSDEEIIRYAVLNGGTRGRSAHDVLKDLGDHIHPGELT